MDRRYGLTVIALSALSLMCLMAQPADVPVGIITTVAGNGNTGYAGDGGPAIRASLREPRAVAVDADGSLYIADSLNNRIRKVDRNGIITTVAGNGSSAEDNAYYIPFTGLFAGDGGPAIKASLFGPQGLAVGVDGSLYIADTENNRVCKVDREGIITTIVGRGVGGYGGDGGPATRARLTHPKALALGVDGSLYIADSGNHRIRKVDRAGNITTVAGSGTQEYLGDGGPATKAGFDRPAGVAVSADGSVYIADTQTGRIRKVDGKGIITTVAGGGYGVDGDVSEAAPATKASLYRPSSVAVGVQGDLFIAEATSHFIRKVDPAGRISTVAGNGMPGYSGDRGPAHQASLSEPSCVAIAPDGSLYIADSGNNRIRKVSWK